MLYSFNFLILNHFLILFAILKCLLSVFLQLTELICKILVVV